MEHDFLGRSIGKFLGATENLICVFRTGYSKRKFVFTSPDFYVPFAQTVDRPVCTCKW